jgi:tRNA A37 threonylcarbamoyladenosine dehydratase
LVDFDLVCITNTNRQLHAMKGTVGKQKVEVMAERLRLIHPTSTIDAMPIFYSEAARDRVLGTPENKPDFVVDAIDNVTAKLDLIATCVRREIPIVATMGAAGRLDPTRVKIRDLAKTERDGLAKDVRKWLQRKWGVALNDDGELGIPAVYSDEPIALPADVLADAGGGFACVCPHGSNDAHSCEKRARIDGTASFVTGTFGLVAAGYVVRAIAKPDEATRVKRTPRPAESKDRRVREIAR